MALCETVSIHTDNRLTGITLIIIHNLFLNKIKILSMYLAYRIMQYIYKMNDL